MKRRHEGEPSRGLGPLSIFVLGLGFAASQPGMTLAAPPGSLYAQQAYVKASNTGAGDWFGFTSAVHGDTIAVAARQEDSAATGIDGDQTNNGAPDSGAVYVFTREGRSWAQQAYVKASNTNAGDMFGYDLAIDGDTLVVGAPGESSNATGINGNQADNSSFRAGAVYVFRRANGIWTQEAYIKASNTGVDDWFGYSVAIHGDTLAVSAKYEDSAASGVNGSQLDNSLINSGAVYIFTRNNNVWSQEAYIKASNPGVSDEFGVHVALFGDTLAVSTVLEDSAATGINGNQADNSAPSSGAVYIFSRTNGSWVQEAYVKASNTGAGDQFGSELALENNLLAVGAGAEDSTAAGVNGDQSSNGAPESGAAYVFTRKGGVWEQDAYLKASNTNAQDRFGATVALHGNKLAVGAPWEASCATGVNGNQTDNNCFQAGAVYTFSRKGNTWSQDAYMKASNTGTGDQFGRNVALSNAGMAVGAYQEDSSSTGIDGTQADNSAGDSGAVYVFAPGGPVR